MLRRSDRTLLLSVRSDGVPVSGRAKEKKTGSTELWLCPVSCDRTRPVVILGVLDLSGINRTLGGSAGHCHRSVRSVENMWDSISFLCFLSRHVGATI